MAKLRSITLLITVLLTTTHALYEDQIGKFDWKRSYVGKIKYATIDDTSKRIIVTTEENVIASLNQRNGHIQWRQLVEDRRELDIKLLHVVDNKEIVTISAALGGWFVRGWELTTGTLLWEWTVSAAADQTPPHCEWLIRQDQLLHVLPVTRSHVEVTTYKLRTGETRGVKTRTIPAADWLHDPSKCVVSSTYYVCLSSGHLYYFDLLTSSDNKQFDSKLLVESDDGSIVSFSYDDKPAVLLVRQNIARVVLFDGPEIKILAHDLSPNIVSLPLKSGDYKQDMMLLYQLEINSDNPNKLIKATRKDAATGQDIESIEIDYPLGLGAPSTKAGQCKSASSCDLLLQTADNAVLLVHLPDGKVAWIREEALSNIVATEFFELPVSELDASIENEFKTSSNDFVSILYHRLSTQAKQVYNALFGGQLLANNGLVRDEFGLHKIIVVATKVGKLFGIDTLTGSVVWSYRLPNTKPFHGGLLGNRRRGAADDNSNNNLLMFAQRTARYAPHPAVCTLFAEDISTGNAIRFEFDPITGASSAGIEKLEYRIKQAMLLPYEDDNHLKPIITVSHSDDVFIYPVDSGTKLMQKHKSTAIYLYTVAPTMNLLNGYQVIINENKNNNLQLRRVWDINLGESKLVAISTRPSAERVHSQGRVLPDRSVYYKYVNPNLIALAVLTDDPVHKHVLSIYLVDGITGLILYSTSHKRAKGPVHLVHSENWLVYSYFNERFRRTEICGAELYEGHIQSNSTVFSSHSVSQLPHVQTQSYILPATVSSMTVTLTERGITNKFLLLGLTTGAVSEVPWLLLQPRFTDIACGPEESCIPYMPEIPLPSEAVINYNQSLARIDGIQVAPARLESTSHVLVYGLDMFYTRVAPSKTFDVLKEDFEYHLIVLVLGGLVLASYATKQLAARKSLRQAWK